MNGMDLKAERKNRGLGIVDAAKRIGVSYHTLRMAEAGMEPRAEQAVRIADFYGTTVSELWPTTERAA